MASTASLLAHNRDRAEAIAESSTRAQQPAATAEPSDLFRVQDPLSGKQFLEAVYKAQDKLAELSKNEHLRARKATEPRTGRGRSNIQKGRQIDVAQYKKALIGALKGDRIPFPEEVNSVNDGLAQIRGQMLFTARSCDAGKEELGPLERELDALEEESEVLVQTLLAKLCSEVIEEKQID